MGKKLRDLIVRAESVASTPEQREELLALRRFLGVRHIADAAGVRLPNYDVRRRAARALGGVLGANINPWDL